MAVFKFRNLKNGQASPLPPGEFTVGRADDAYVHLEDASVSWHHARLINNDEGFFLEDLGSANGTSLRGAPLLGKMKLGFGDLVSIGDIPFRIDPEAPPETSITPSAGLHRVARNTIRRETERLPNRPAVVGKITALEPISAQPIQSVEKAPERGSPAPPRRTGALVAPPTLDAVGTGAIPQTPGHLIRKSVPLPTLVRLTQPPGEEARSATAMEPKSTGPEPQAKPMEREAHNFPPLSAAPASASVSEIDEDPAVEEEEASSSFMSIGWTMLFVFMAGVGAGLLLGLYFAKLFLEMGGKAVGLP